MGKLSPSKRFKIKSFFGGMKPHIDSVKYSLEHLVFANDKEVERRIIKKRWRVAISTAMLLITVSIFISPLGTADSVLFYPKTCLGGWLNPAHAEGEPQALSNLDPEEFTKDNSAILPKDTQAEIYCGNFSGDFKSNTKPVKMLVTLSVSLGEDVLMEETIVSDSFASSTQEILDTASSTEVSFTLATSTATSTELATTTEIETTTQISTSTQGGGVLEKVLDVVQDILGTKNAENQPGESSNATPEQTTETGSSVPTPAPAVTSPEVTPPVEQVETQNVAPQPETPPTSYQSNFFEAVTSLFFIKVFAQETNTTTPEVTPATLQEVTVQSISTTSQESTSESTGETVVETAPRTSSLEVEDIPTTVSTEVVTLSSSTEGLSERIELGTTTATTTEQEGATSTSATTTEASQSASSTPLEPLLEIYYTFDGVDWYLLGELDSESIKYRTFEIPATATTTWDDMGRLQLKVIPKANIDSIPTVYLDGIKLEVLYETDVERVHPDFTHDTILSDDTLGDIRIVRIINSDNNLEEVWYMYLAATTTTGASTTMLENATGTDEIPELSSTTVMLASTTSTTTLEVEVSSSSSPVSTSTKPIVRIQKNTWYKLEISLPEGATAEQILKVIQEEEKKKKIIEPDFTRDILKNVKGTIGDIVIVHLEQDGVDTLWLFNLNDGTRKKIDEEGISSFAEEYPFGIKDRNVFWLSYDRGKVYTYNIDSAIIEFRDIPPYDQDAGARGEVFFSSTPWKVLVGRDHFAFHSEVTGEVFSDDNLTTVEAFRLKEELDTLVGKEKLEALNFIVDDKSNE